jgi:hypothetical protein
VDTKLTITPKHLAIAVVAIIVAVIALPMINASYEMAYPPVGSVRRMMMDTCAEERTFNRWSSSQVEMCLAYQRVLRR